MLDISSPLDGIVSPFGASRGFSPKALFNAYPTAQGFWYDASDLSTMFQDNLGATPVTATGQSVGRILDKSGRGNHATQSNASFKPTLQQDANGFYYLNFDGTDDSLSTSAIDFSSTDKVSLFAGARKAADPTASILVELSATIAANAGAFYLTAPESGASQNFGFKTRGSVNPAVPVTSGALAAPYTAILTGLGDIANDGMVLRVNGAQVASSSTDQGTGNYGNYAMFMGRRNGASLAFSGRLYSLVGLGAAATTTQIASTETWVNSKTGAY